MNSKLDLNKEFFTCLFIWCSAVFYSIYSFTSDANTFFQDREDYDLFENGWTFLRRKRDKSDFEYEDLLYVYIIIGPYMVLYLAITEVLQKLTHNAVVIQCVQLIFSTALIWLKFGNLFLLTTLAQPVAYTAAYVIWPRKITMYLCTLGSLLFNKFYLQNILEDMGQSLQEMIFLASTSMWITLKCTSFYLENPNINFSLKCVLNLTAYSLYLPVLFSGPFIFYESYINAFKENSTNSFKIRLKTFAQNQLRLIYWLTVTHFSLHYVYLTAIQYYPEALLELKSWSLYGLGYLMGQFFHLKYVLLYGIGTSVAKFQNVDVPPLPRCIGRIHLYSDMWRYFDVGFYQFLLRYIYIPTLLKKTICNKILSSALSFIFVWMWHGFSYPIFLWSFMNYIGIILELSVTFGYNSYLKISTEKIIPKSIINRLKFCLTACLMVLSSISNFYYFSGIEVTNIFIDRLFQDPWYKTTILLGIFYTLSVVSSSLRCIPAKQM